MMLVETPVAWPGQIVDIKRRLVSHHQDAPQWERGVLTQAVYTLTAEGQGHWEYVAVVDQGDSSRLRQRLTSDEVRKAL